MTVDPERVARALKWADKVAAPGSGFSGVTVRATVVELAHLVRDLTGEPDDQPPPCPRCGEPMHKVAIPDRQIEMAKTFEVDTGDGWVWGHNCVPI